MKKYEPDNLNAGYAEFLTSVDTTPGVILARIAICLVSLLIIIFSMRATLNTMPAVSFFLLVAILFVTYFVLRYTKVEYEYIIATGEFELSRILAERTRKVYLTFKTADIESVSEGIDASAPAPLFFTCKKNDKFAYTIVYSSNGVKKSLVISAPPKTVQCLKYYCSRVFKTAE